jgi:hypothetical protein
MVCFNPLDLLRQWATRAGVARGKGLAPSTPGRLGYLALNGLMLLEHLPLQSSGVCLSVCQLISARLFGLRAFLPVFFTPPSGTVFQRFWRSEVVLQDLINEVDNQYEEGYSRQPPESAPEKYGCQNGQQYQDQILLPAHAGAGQAEIAPMHARASTPVVLIVFLEP